MMRVLKLNLLFLFILFLLSGILISSQLNPASDNQFYCGVMSSAEQQQPALKTVHVAGETLFKENCKSCHRIHEESVGPALFGITERRPKKYIYAFIQNSQRLISKGDTMAINVYNKYNKAEMTSFPTFTKAHIDSILLYIEQGPRP